MRDFTGRVVWWWRQVTLHPNVVSFLKGLVFPQKLNDLAATTDIITWKKHTWPTACTEHYRQQGQCLDKCQNGWGNIWHAVFSTIVLPKFFSHHPNWSSWRDSAIETNKTRSGQHIRIALIRYVSFFASSCYLEINFRCHVAWPLCRPNLSLKEVKKHSKWKREGRFEGWEAVEDAGKNSWWLSCPAGWYPLCNVLFC